MDVDLTEAAAGAIAGGGAGQAINPAKGEHGHAGHACADCGAEAKGKFCTDCGQPIHVHRTLYHLGHELLHGVMHFDGRIWRTIPLLLANPGKLTRQWCEGKRARYVSPLAIFLFTLFILFFGLSFAPQANVNVASAVTWSADERAQAEKALADAKAELAQIDAAFAGSNGAERIELGTRKGALAGVIASLEGRLQAAEAAPEADTAPTSRNDGLEPGSWQAQVADLRFENDGKGFMATIGKKLKNPDYALYKLQQTAYKFSFLLVPLSIPFMWLLLVWRRGFTLYDHGVFVLYSLTFVAILTSLAIVIGSIWPFMASILAWGVGIIIPVHMFAQLKGTYGLSVFSALWRTLVLLVFSAIVMTLFLTAIVYLGLGH